MEIRTHPAINRDFCGSPAELRAGFSRVTLTAVEEMAADDAGLVHGGFVFGLADYAAMLAVNHPYVVLGGADVRFLKPVRVGDALVAEAAVETAAGKKNVVKVGVRTGDVPVFAGTFVCYVLDKHVLTD